MVEKGVDILELGIPFSDPEAEGPAIQASSERALKQGIRTGDVLDLVARFRRSDDRTPVLLMGYVNSIERMGVTRFVEQASTAGVDGLIMVNLPPEEAAELKDALAKRNMDLIFLVAPTTSAKRMDLICNQASGFIYYVSLKGTTGAGHLDLGSVAERLEELRRHTTLPVQVGFGIRDGNSARGAAELADGVVVGSALVEIMAAHAENPSNIPDLLGEQVALLRQAMDSPRR